MYLSCKPAAIVHPPLPAPAKEIRKLSFPYYALQDERDLDVLLNEIGNKKFVLLGEASHGTEEYYTWRAALSKRLIKEKGFNLLAVEGDWGDMYSVNEYIHGKASHTITNLLQSFTRWPTWIWANEEFAGFAAWLKAYNQSSSSEKNVSIYGLDVFAFPTALNSLISLLHDTASLSAARAAKDCLSGFGNDAIAYSTGVFKRGVSCQAPVEHLWKTLPKPGKKKSFEDLFRQQLAAVVLDGEAYFRTREDLSESWNRREAHMQETVRRLVSFYGKETKVIIWAHNSHVGDARYTDMPLRRRTNLGEAIRKEWGEKEVFLAGFTSYTGQLTSGYVWGAPSKTLPLRAAKDSSWEELLHRDGGSAKIILSKDIRHIRRLDAWLEHRSAGVVHSETYIPSVTPRRYDAYVYFDTTHALHLLKNE